MKTFIRTWKNRCFGEDIPLDVQTFNLLALAGIIAGITIALSSIVTSAGAANIVINLSASCLGWILLLFTNRTGRYHLAYWIVVVLLFLIGFPVLFFTAGAYRSGMPSFYIFAIIFTALMLRGWERFFAIAAELVIYLLSYLIAYFYPSTVTHFLSELDYFLDVIIGNVAAIILLLAVIILYIRIHDNDKKKLEKLNNLRGEFLRNVSHELKTPLTSVSGFAQASQSILQSEPLSVGDIEQLRVCSGFMISESDRMIRLTKQLLDVAAAEHGGIHLNRSAVSIADISEIIKIFHFPALDKNNNKLCLDIPDTLPLVYADSERVLQVFINLLSNALRHTKQGTISISARQEKQTLLISIKDTGSGISHELKPLLFKSYLNVGAARGAGMGIGLYISKKIMDAHNGDIRIESEQGKGTAVFFTLPIAKG